MRAEASRLPLVLAIAAVILQISYPLTHGQARHGVTIAIVLVFAAASAAHAVLSCGLARGLSIVLLAVCSGYGVEVLGVHTGFPFGHYSYAATLGPRVFAVPVVIGAAWAMLAWPAAVVARRLASSFVARVAVGAWALATWDLFLDPQMVRDGHWRWRFPSPHLPGVPGVPLTNYVGWLLVSVVISLALQGIARNAGEDRDGRKDAIPTALYLWTYLGSIIAFIAFLDLGGAALWGALGMGVVAVPLVVRLVR